MKVKETLSIVAQSFFITLAIGILLLCSIILLSYFYKKYKNKIQHEGQITDIDEGRITDTKNQIEYIQFSTDYIITDKNQGFALSLGIKTKDRDSAEKITDILNNANIFSDSRDFKVELQKDQTTNRDNLITIVFYSDEKYNPEFKKIINKLIDSEYIYSESQQKQAQMKKSINELNTRKKLSD